MNAMPSNAPNWEAIRAASMELDQMASQIVMKACDIGDMLRAVRLTMDAKSFNTHVYENLSRPQNWAARLIILSFRRSAVLEALSNGKANDSIRSAYEHIKELPAPPDEIEERNQWPRAKRGPAKGAENAGRPRTLAPDTQPPMSEHERSAWDDAMKEGSQMIAEFADRQAEREEAKSMLSASAPYQAAAAKYLEILQHLESANRGLRYAQSFYYFDLEFWYAATRHAAEIVRQLEKLPCK